MGPAGVKSAVLSLRVCLGSLGLQGVCLGFLGLVRSLFVVFLGSQRFYCLELVPRSGLEGSRLPGVSVTPPPLPPASGNGCEDV